ncbi:MAG: CBS domain-containing protein [Caldilineaceae bacterium]
MGVITRREADRAINHGLGDSAVRRFMQAGNVSVRPSDSVQLLRQTMIDSGWGQIPVVDDQERIIGIVTRTDLIKLWDGEPSLQDRKAEIDERLRTFLSSAQYMLLRRIGGRVSMKWILRSMWSAALCAICCSMVVGRQPKPAVTISAGSLRLMRWTWIL